MGVTRQQAALQSTRCTSFSPRITKTKQTSRCVTMMLLLSLLTTDPECAKLDSPEMTLPEPSSPPSLVAPPPGSDGRYGTEGLLCWRRGPEQEMNPHPEVP